MKICQAHWDKLRAKLDEAGLGHFGVKSGEQASEIFQQQLQGDDSAFDPLLNANFAIWSNALNNFGLEMMAPDAPCPLCYLDDCAKNGCGDPNCTRKHDSGDDWIGYAVKDQIDNAKKRGLVKPEIVN